MSEHSLADIVMAHRYLYYIEGMPAISDQEYDAMEALAVLDAEADHPIHKPGSDLSDSYSEDIRALARSLRK